jgi:hypothetical protein
MTRKSVQRKARTPNAPPPAVSADLTDVRGLVAQLGGHNNRERILKKNARVTIARTPVAGVAR